MFEQTSRLAEKVASRVSRRGFLGSLGGWAAAAAMGMAGVLTGAGTAWAGRHCDSHHPCGGVCCKYASGLGDCGIVPAQTCNKCPPTFNGCPLVSCGINKCGGGFPQLCFC
jgi:hypothetical protein